MRTIQRHFGRPGAISARAFAGIRFVKPNFLTSRYSAIWFLVFFVTTESYGLRMSSWGGLGTASLGWFGALQLLLIVVSLATVRKGFNYLLGAYRSKLGLAVLILAAVMPIYALIVTLGRGKFGSVVGIWEIFRNLMFMKALLPYFLFAYLVSRPQGLKTALDMLALHSVIAALAIPLVIFLQIETAVVLISTSDDDITRLFRAIFPTALLVAAGWLLLWSRYLVQGGLITLAASMVCLFATVIQLHRSTIIAVVAVLVFLLVQTLRLRGFSQTNRKRTLAGIAASILITAGYYGFFRLPTTSEFLMSAVDELLSSSGNAGHRTLIITNSFNYVFSETLGLGLGLDWKRVEDLEHYLYAAFVAGPTFDSSYANVIIVFGVPGVLLFVWMLFNLFLIGNLQSCSQTKPEECEVAFFLRPFLLYCAILGLASDIVMVSPNAVTFALVIVIAVQLAKLQRRGGGRKRAAWDDDARLRILGLRPL